jgi:hypothetical protein
MSPDWVMYRTQGSEGYCSCGHVSIRWLCRLLNIAYLWLDDLQVPHLDTRCCEIRNLELDVDGSLSLASANTTHASTESTHHTTTLLVVSSYRGKTQLGTHEELFTSTELLDLPYYRRCLGRVVHGTNVGAETRGVGVFGYGNGDLDVVGCAPPLKLCSCLSLLATASSMHRIASYL